MTGRMSRLQQRAMFAKMAANKLGNIRFIEALPFKRNRLPVQVAVAVPSTRLDKAISDKEFQKRIDSEKRFFSSKFGGDTSVKAVGSFLLDKKLIKEKVVLVESSMTVQNYNKRRKELASHFVKRRKEWDQNSLLVKVEGQTFIVPKRPFIDNDKGQKSKILVS